MFESHPALVGDVSYPVIAVKSNGIVIGKNSAAKTKLGGIRLSSDISRLPRDVGYGISLIGNFEYKNALKFCADVPGGQIFIYLFPPRLQSDDFEDIAKNIGVLSPKDVADHAHGEYDRLYSEIGAAFSNFDRRACQSGDIADGTKLVELCSNKLSSGFRALGGRATVSCSESFGFQRYFVLNVSSFLAAIMEQAYIAMRASRSGSCEVTCDYDERSGEISVTALSKTAIPDIPESSAGEVIRNIVPECEIDVWLDEKLSMSPKPSTVRIRNGLFEMRSYLTAKVPKTPVLHSALRGSLSSKVAKAYAVFSSKAKAYALLLSKNAQ
ncbi:MAG: hypothetical protein KBS59_00390 [Clostridiales bacterium]|nr:hypothetical protein [Clostridiales bacterium]